PSAHSFNGLSRQWNVANNNKYISALLANEIPAESETLTEADKFNEYIMTSLRTKWGLDLKYLENNFPSEFIKEINPLLEKNISEGKIKQEDSIYTLTTEGKLLADQIAS